MRGEVLHYDENQGFGFIAGADGNRYAFARENLRREFPVSKGTLVEFKEGGGQARDIFSIRGESPSRPGVTPMPESPQHFGRLAINDTPSPGLWRYFCNGLSTNYANFRGRARRKEYWGYYLFWVIALMLLSIAGLAVDAALGNLDAGNELLMASLAAPGLFVLATLVPGIAMCVRRQHDIGLSGWFFLLIFVPYIGNLIIFVFSLIPSQKHENKWGPVPAGVHIPPAFVPGPVTPGTSK